MRAAARLPAASSAEPLAETAGARTTPRRARGPAAALTAVFLAASLAAACSPMRHTHGYTPRASELDDIQVGVDTRASVQNKLGRPSTLGAFDDEEWLYISIKSETVAFFEPEVTEQRVVMVVFDQEGRVTDVGDYGLEDGRVIDLVSRTTPTSGRKLTILQQAFQNIGRFGGSSAIQRVGGGVPGAGAP